MQYRPDIDGLRALAVLSVLFFHLGFETFGGGYVGVDVFFVISGFLITQLIRAEVQHTTAFSFSNFYMRRARRLAPALFFTCIVCFAFAMVLFSPSDLQRFSGALLHAVVSLSNFYFWTESGYFDTAATIKPLLHTWSLSVEEQFYLVWPITLVFLLTKAPRYAVPLVLVLAGLFSLALNLDFYGGNSEILQAIAPSISSWFSDGPATIYYLAPFRVFEFAIGASLVFLSGREPARIVSEIGSILGLALILFTAMFYSQDTPFPTVFALPPCIGTALLIYFARTSKYTNLVLSQRWLVRLGLTSYSLYLIHWPIIVFYTYYTKASLSIGERWGIVLISIVAAEMMFRWVEKPFRHNSRDTKQMSPSGFGLVCAMIALAICVVAAGSWANQGWTWRFGQGAEVKTFGDIAALQRERGAYLRSHLAEEFSQQENKRKILVVGDSLGDDLLISLVQNLGDNYEVQTQRYNQLCYKIFLGESPPEDGPCDGILAGLESSKELPMADEVYVAFSMGPTFWATEFAPLLEYVQRRTKPGTRIVLFGRRPEFTDLHSIAVSMLAQDQSVEQVEQRAREIVGDLAPLDANMKAAAEELGVDFISSFDMICSEDRCKFFAADGSLIFWDMHHLTVQGATWFGAQVVDELEKIRTETPRPAETQTTGQPSVPTALADMPFENAVTLIQSYMSELTRISMNGQTVQNISLLPASKSEIGAALLILIKHATDQESKSNYKTGYIILAFFQADVGETSKALDKMGPQQKTWQEIVDLEMNKRGATLTELGYGIEREPGPQ
jgi:peptidoglycan/LPS O-acetylase OafA/YrhL